MFTIDPIVFIWATAALTVVMMVYSILFQEKLSETQKKWIFALIALPVLLTTVYIGTHTIYKNIISETGGPVHWHADYQVWVCDERLDLVDPRGLRNKIGNPLLHEHDDDRIHVEGTVLKLEDVNLGSFFYTIGGILERDHISYLSTNGMVDIRDGALCGAEPASLKVFVNGRLLENPKEHLITQEAYVPPGDCIIVEFSPGDIETTDRLCTSWEVKDWNYQNFEKLRGESNGN